MVAALKNTSIVLWSFRVRWTCCAAMNKVINFKVSHIFREGDKCVDRLSSLGIDSKSDFIRYDIGCPIVLDIIFSRDRFGFQKYIFV